MLGAAVAFQPLVIVALSILIAMGGRSEALGLIVRAGRGAEEEEQGGTRRAQRRQKALTCRYISRFCSWVYGPEP